VPQFLAPHALQSLRSANFSHDACGPPREFVRRIQGHDL
jgi:hypothetical protein